MEAIGIQDMLVMVMIGSSSAMLECLDEQDTTMPINGLEIDWNGMGRQIHGFTINRFSLW
jgi:hypothetical protein